MRKWNGMNRNWKARRAEKLWVQKEYPKVVQQGVVSLWLQFGGNRRSCAKTSATCGKFAFELDELPSLSCKLNSTRRFVASQMNFTLRVSHGDVKRMTGRANFHRAILGAISYRTFIIRICDIEKNKERERKRERERQRKQVHIQFWFLGHAIRSLDYSLPRPRVKRRTKLMPRQKKMKKERKKKQRKKTFHSAFMSWPSERCVMPRSIQRTLLDHGRVALSGAEIMQFT